MTIFSPPNRDNIQQRGDDRGNNRGGEASSMWQSWFNDIKRSVSYVDLLKKLAIEKPAPSNATDTDHDITIPAGVYTITNGTESDLVELKSDITKRIDATWAVGTGNGGMASGVSLSANTMYYVQIIVKRDKKTIDAQFDTSATAANRDTSYPWYGLIRGNFVVFTNSSSNIRNFTIVGDQMRYLSAIGDVNDSTITANTYETGTITAPPNSVALLSVTTEAVASSGNAGAYVTLKNPTSTEAKNIILSVASTVARISGHAEFPVNASRQLQYKAQLYVGNTINYVGIHTGGYLLQG